MEHKVHSKKTLSEVLSLFNEVHKGKYDYSLITNDNYINTHHKVPIICKEHGVFLQSPVQHYNAKQGCLVCAVERMAKNQTGKEKNNRKIKYGVGVYDVDCSCTDKEIYLFYRAWCSMLRRCYGNQTSWIGCSVTPQWHHFSAFLKWAKENGFKKGYHLDKDILVKGNKLYSPETCCFVPREINDMMVKGNSLNRKHLLGVSQRGRLWYAAHGSSLIKGYNGNLGYFQTKEEAFAAYKASKERYIKMVATKYFNDNLITEKVYNALITYEVNIND